MPLPSFHVSARASRSWSIPRAAAYGAGIGALAALFKTTGPLHAAGPVFAHGLEIAAVTAAFAALCAAAAYLRNVVARRFIWPDIR
jgi:hypothetical protein